MPHFVTSAQVAWKVADEMYLRDRVEEAFAEIEDSGIGERSHSLSYFRMIEAEATTRRDSVVFPVTDWLELEVIPDELGMDLDPEGLGAEVLASCSEVGRRLGYDLTAKTRVAFLAADADAPWATAPYGYCVDKYPYEKICLPHHLLGRPRERWHAVAHEYAHVVSINLSHGHAPNWLGEAVSVLSEGQFDPRAERLFSEGRWPWREPEKLEGMFDVTHGDPETVWRAYQQAGLIGRFLAETIGEKGLGDLLRTLGSEGLLAQLFGRFLGRTRTDLALRRHCGFGERDLFAKTLQWIRA